MRLPDLDPSGGPLMVREILIEYDGPQLFTLKNAAGSTFIALHGPSEGKNDIWLFSRVDNYCIRLLKSNKITLREAVTRRTHGISYLVYYIEDIIEDIKTYTSQTIPEKFLPDYDSYLGERDQGIVTPDLHKSVGNEDFNELPVPIERDLWEFDQSTIDFFKSRMTPLNVVASRRGRLVADIIFSSGDHRTDFPIPELGKILLNFQKTVDSLAVDTDALMPKLKPSASAKRQTRLDAVATYPSSFALRIEAHEGSLLEDAKSEIAFTRLMALLSAVQDEDRFKEIFRIQTIDTKLHFGEVIKAISKAKSSIKVRVGSAYKDEVRETSVTAEYVNRLADKIGEINEQESDYRAVIGRLRAVSMKTKFFLIESDDESISGRISDSLISIISGSEINAWYNANVEERKIIHDITGEISSKFTLLQLEKIAAADAQPE